MADSNIIDLDELGNPQKKPGLLLTGLPVLTDCKRCLIKDVCSYRDDDANACGLAEAAVKEFGELLKKNTFTDAQDRIAIKSLSGIYSSLIILEHHLNKFGMFGASISNMHEYYHKLHKTLMEGLEKFGLTPSGRKSLLTKMKQPIPGSSLTLYLQSKAKKVVSRPVPVQLLPGKEFHPLRGMIDGPD